MPAGPAAIATRFARVCSCFPRDGNRDDVILRNSRMPSIAEWSFAEFRRPRDESRNSRCRRERSAPLSAISPDEDVEMRYPHRRGSSGTDDDQRRTCCSNPPLNWNDERASVAYDNEDVEVVAGRRVRANGQRWISDPRVQRERERERERERGTERKELPIRARTRRIIRRFTDVNGEPTQWHDVPRPLLRPRRIYYRHTSLSRSRIAIGT